MKDIFFQQLNNQVEFIAHTVAGHEGKFDKIDKILERINARFEQVDRRFDIVIEKLLNHDQRLVWIDENMVTKKEFQELMNTIDYSVKQVMGMKEDHVFGVEWMKRMQEQLGWHEQDLKKLKLMLNLA